VTHFRRHAPTFVAKRSARLTQNIYDNQKFFEKYQRLPRSLNGLPGAPEWPALRALLPTMGGLRVLDLGCGVWVVQPLGPTKWSLSGVGHRCFAENADASSRRNP
jgi:hypothetical protein